MHKIKRYMARLLLVMLLSFSMTVTTGGIMYCVAEAATVAPTLSESKKTLYVGSKTYKLGIKNKAKMATVTFKSGNTKVATVTKDGIVKPVAAGTSTITVTVKQNGKTYSLKLTVTVKKPYIELTSSTDYLNAGETYLLKAKSYGIEDSITWSISDDKVASISKAGKLTANTEGRVTVTAAAGKYKERIEVHIGTNRLGVFQKNITCYNDITMHVKISEPIEDEILTADTLSKSYDIIDFDWEKQTEFSVLPITIKPKKVGTDILIITSDQTSDRLYIKVTVIEEPKDKAELNAKEIYAKCSPATVVITANTEFGDTYTGSGFFIDNGLLVTNYHVIEGTSRISVKTQENKEYEVKELVGFNASLDLAVLRINSKNPILKISQDGATTGEDVYALGSPLGLTGTISDGMVSTSSRVIDGVDFIQITAPISPGNSGGPLLNAYGEVIGVNTMYFENGQNLNFAINIKELQRINTNRPITVKEYIENYNSNKVIYEDPSVSGDPRICQDIFPMVGVAGAITDDEWWDCYYFMIDQPVYVTGLIMLGNEMDMQLIRFQIYNYTSDNPVAAGKDTIIDGQPLLKIDSTYLTPGDYFVSVWLPDEYVGEDIPYMFMISYKAAQ